MGEYRKKPVVITAVQWDGTFESFLDAADMFDGPMVNWRDFEEGEEDTTHLVIHTLEGAMRAEPGDWIVRGVKGEGYPVKPDIFELTYEEA